MKLYYSPGACSLAPHIVARELGLAIELVEVDLGTHRLKDGRDYHAINPRGYVPALQLDDGTVLTEVAAIVQYLADLSPAAALLPPAGSLDRVRVQSWLVFIATELHKVFSPWLWHKETAESTVVAAKERLALRFAELDALLATRGTLAATGYSVADAYAFAILNWTNFLGIPLDAYPALQAYLKRIAARPAVLGALRAERLVKQAA